MKHTVIYPGTFDPVTNGHLDIITRASKLFPRLIVAVAGNVAKRPFFSLPDRVRFIEEAIGQTPGITVVGFENLLVQLAESMQAPIILRGL